MFKNAIRIVPADPLVFDGMVFPIRNGLFLDWQRDCHPTVLRARCFNVDVAFIYPFPGIEKWRKVLRHLVSVPLTLLTLFRRMPDVVFAVNVPPALVMSVYLFSFLTGRPYVLDGHSKPYEADAPLEFRLFLRHFTRRALFSINHNPSDVASVRSYGGHSVFLPMVPLKMEFPPGGKAELAQPSVLFVCSFTPDEPLDVVFDVARELPEVAFYVTGDVRKVPAAVRDAKPDNLSFTGFLPREDYLAHLGATSLVLTLSRRANIMQMAVDECLCYGAALVTNRTPVLMDLCEDAAAYTGLDVKEIASRIRSVLGDVDGYRARMKQRRQLLQDRLQPVLQEAAREYFNSDLIKVPAIG